MRSLKISILFAGSVMFLASCGVNGDPGHCYFSVDWEYYNEDYRVYYYEDTNPEIPEYENIDPGFHYDCYPGIYDYYYESEDRAHWYQYTGTYTLVQNLGYEGGLFRDGLNGVDTFYDLFLYIYAKKGLSLDEHHSAAEIDNDDNSVLPVLIEVRRSTDNNPIRVENRSWKSEMGPYTISIDEEVKVFVK